MTAHANNEKNVVDFTLEIPRHLHDSLNRAYVSKRGETASLKKGIIDILQNSDLRQERALEQISAQVNDNINLAIPQDLYDRLLQAAVRHDTSERQIILRLMQEYVEKNPLPLLTSKGGPINVGSEGTIFSLTPPDVPALPASEKSIVEQAADKVSETLHKKTPSKFRI